jgi:hypothetical protein
MTPELRDKLGKVLALLTSPHDGERLAAATRFSALIEAHGVHPSQVLANGNAGTALTEEQMRQIYDEGYQRGHADGQQAARPGRDWTPAGGASAEAGSDAERIRVILDAAERSANDGLLSDWEVTFSESIRDRFRKYGRKMYVSEKQWESLDRLETKLRCQGYLD